MKLSATRFVYAVFFELLHYSFRFYRLLASTGFAWFRRKVATQVPGLPITIPKASTARRGAPFFLLLLPIQLVFAADLLVVDTQYGPVRGLNHAGVCEFLGIPFAHPPVGVLRWYPPQDPESWSGVLDAFEFPPTCPQKDFEQGQPDSLAMLIGAEDCLYLNVWTPSVADSARAVLVYIHGGGNQQGSSGKIQGGARIFDGKALAVKNNVVVVTIQYRLGALGFLVHPGLATESEHGVSGNYGLLDQIQALKWVQQNITRFGGDSTRVMLFGESGGAVDVSLLLTSPLAAGLFHRALIQSGAPIAKNYADAEAAGLAYAQKRGCGSGSPQDQIAGLRSLPADSFVVDLVSPFSGGIAQMNWGGVIDGWALPLDPLEAMETGAFNHVPLVVGSNADETSITAAAKMTPEMTQAFFRLSVPSEYYDQVLRLYPPGNSNSQSRQAFVNATTDAQFTVNVRRMARAVAQNQDEPVWRYFFSHHLSGLSGYLGAYHGLELFFVFESISSTTYAQNGEMTAKDDRVKDAMGKYWTNFAKTGNPNGDTLTEWPEYNPLTDAYLDINAAPVGGMYLRTEKCDFWDTVRKTTTAAELYHEASPHTFRLEQNYPNPFNPTTTIRYRLTTAIDVNLTIYNSVGQELRRLVNSKQSAGEHSVQWDATDDAGNPVGSGLYLIRLTSDPFTSTKKSILIR